MDIITVQLVHLSDLTEGLPNVICAIRDGDFSQVTWGDANRTLIDVDFFKLAIKDNIEDGVSEEEMTELTERLARLPAWVYIDLEN